MMRTSYITKNQVHSKSFRYVFVGKISCFQLISKNGLIVTITWLYLELRTYIEQVVRKVYRNIVNMERVG